MNNPVQGLEEVSPRLVSPGGGNGPDRDEWKGFRGLRKWPPNAEWPATGREW